MLFNCKKCKALTLEYINNASGLDLHRFNWLEVKTYWRDRYSWNYLVAFKIIQTKEINISLDSWRSWFKDQRTLGGSFHEWFA